MSPEIITKILMAIAAAAIGWILARRSKAQWVRLVDVFVESS